MFYQVPFSHDDEDESPDISEMLDEAMEYILRRRELDKMEPYSEFELAEVKNMLHEHFPEELDAGQAWLVCATLISVYGYLSQKEAFKNLPEKLQEALEAFKGVLGNAADVRVIDMNKSDDPLAKLLRQMPDHPENN